MRTADVVVIGAGPAGLAAAAQASLYSDNVVLLDSQARLGGQYWRHGYRDEQPGGPAPKSHHDWGVFDQLRSQIRTVEAAGKLRVFSGTNVVSAFRGEDGQFHVHIAQSDEVRTPDRGCDGVIRTGKVILCAGAYDRQLPVDGWTLPGVMTAGGVQAFVKTQYEVPGKRVLIAGTGPFLLAAAATVIEAGGEVAAVCEFNRLTNWAPRGIVGAAVPKKLLEGVEYAQVLAKHRVPYLTSTAVKQIHGHDKVSAVLTSRVDGNGRFVPGTDRYFDHVDIVGLGWGFVPQVELVKQLGAKTRIDVDGSVVGIVDAHQRSSVEGLYLAGEVTGVAGAAAAVAEARIAGQHAAGATDSQVRDRFTVARHRTFAQAMHSAHPTPEDWTTQQPSNVVVCRCEEVTVGDLESIAADTSARDLRSVKGLSRAGMGYCQGRVCGSALRQFCAQAGAAEEDAAVISKRPIANPLTTDRIAELFDLGE